MIQTIASRLTMRKNGEVQQIKQFSTDGVISANLYTYVDKYGAQYQAFSPFMFWSWRRKHEPTNAE